MFLWNYNFVDHQSLSPILIIGCTDGFFSPKSRSRKAQAVGSFSNFDNEPKLSKILKDITLKQQCCFFIFMPHKVFVWCHCSRTLILFSLVSRNLHCFVQNMIITMACTQRLFFSKHKKRTRFHALSSSLCIFFIFRDFRCYVPL